MTKLVLLLKLKYESITHPSKIEMENLGILKNKNKEINIILRYSLYELLHQECLIF